MNFDKFINDLLIPFFVNLFSTTTAFFLGYYLIISAFKPRIDISPNISYGLDGNESYIYKIKVINRSRLREITSINVQVFATSLKYHKEIPTTQSHRIKVSPSQKLIIYRFKKLKSKSIPSFSARFTIREELKNLKDKYDYLDFRFLYTDSLSGRIFIKTHRYELKKEDLFIDGEFDQDSTFNISES